MMIEIRDTKLEARLQRQMQVTGENNAETALLRLLDTQEEQDRWFQENRNEINSKIQTGIAQLDRGEGIPEEELDRYLAARKRVPE